MKAQHIKKKHDRRVHHQRVQKQRKLQAISETVQKLSKSGSNLSKSNVLPLMQERGYLFCGEQGFVPASKIMDSSNWKRAEQPPSEPKPKVLPSRREKKQKKIVP